MCVIGYDLFNVKLFSNVLANETALVYKSVSNFGSDLKCRENRIFWSEIG